MKKPRSREIKVVVVLLILLNAVNSAPPEGHGTSGIAASLQDGQLGIVFPRWISPRLALVPWGALLWVEDGGTDLSVGLDLRIYRTTAGPVFPYGGLCVSAASFFPKDEEDTLIDYIFGFIFGGEYFLASHFSMGIEGQLNFTKSDEKSVRYGNPGGLNINTATIVYVTLYFK